MLPLLVAAVLSPAPQEQAPAVPAPARAFAVLGKTVVTMAGDPIQDGGVIVRDGKIERVGKDADFVVLSGDPFSVYTRVLQTWVEGKKVFDFADPKDRVYAMGGYGASDGQAMSMCCFATQEGQ